jgi:FkbM family methyltransferase
MQQLFGNLSVFITLLWLINTTSVFSQSPSGFSPKKHVNKKRKQFLVSQNTFRLKQQNIFAQKKLNSLNASFSNKDGLPLSLYLTDKPPKIVTEEELSGKSKCSFLGADCPLEIIEHRLVSEFVEPSDVVLELGGRFGTTSCQIAHKQQNSGKLVVVEPDENVEFILKYNQFIHSCSFWAFNGLISNSSSYVIQAGSYDTRTLPSGNNGLFPKATNGSVINTISFKKLQELLNLQFTVILIDCEGCIQQLFGGTDSAYSAEEH